MGFFSNGKAADLTGKQLVQISLSAIYAKRLGAQLSALSPCLGKKAADILKDQWRVMEPGSAAACLNWLLKRGDSFHFGTVCDAFEKECDHINQVAFAGKREIGEISRRLAEWLTDIKRGSAEESLQVSEMKRIFMYRFMVVAELAFQHGYADVGDVTRAYQYLCGLEMEYPALLRTGLYADFEGMKTLGILAWDLGRAVFVTRLCFEAGFLREEQAWDQIQIAYNKAAAAFRSWDDFTGSYILGVALSSGLREGSGWVDGYFELYQWLRSDSQSPWLKVALK